MQFLGAAGDDQSEFFGRIKYQPQRNAEAIAQWCGQQAGACGGTHEGEGLQIDAHGARGRPLADD
jgi:hypothetical protein